MRFLILKYIISKKYYIHNIFCQSKFYYFFEKKTNLSKIKLRLYCKQTLKVISTQLQFYLLSIIIKL